jgi:hypothetical protein
MSGETTNGRMMTMQYDGITYEIADDATDNDDTWWTREQWADACRELLEPLGVTVVQLNTGGACGGEYDSDGQPSNELDDLITALFVRGPGMTITREGESFRVVNAPGGIYEITYAGSGYVSRWKCNCPAWMQTPTGKRRDCKHLRAFLASNLSDEEDD